MIEHGANPGLISHFTKQGLIDIAEQPARATRRCGAPRPRSSASLKAAGTFNRLAQTLGRQGDPLQRARHADHRPAQGGRRVRQHLEHRGLPRGRHDHGGNGLGHAREGAAAARLPAQGRPAQPDLPGPHGHQHLGALLGAQLQHPRHGGAPRRGLHDLRQAHRLGGRQGRLPPDGALRLLPLRLRHRLAERAARLRLPAAAETSGS